MESDSRNTSVCIEKFNIKLKSKPKDGMILQLHHTVKGSKGEYRRIRFSTGTFDDRHEKLACSDNIGNLFVLDFCDLKFWKIAGVGQCSALQFDPNRMDTLVVATVKKWNIKFIDTESGQNCLRLTGHTAPVKYISFSNSKVPNLLTGSHVEAILWEMKNFTKFFTLNTYSGGMIQQIMFTPGGDYLVACFQNDTVQIWNHQSMKSVKQIIPNELKNMRTIAFTMNGRAMAMAGLANTLILFSMDTWKALKSIDLSKYDMAGALQIAFIPQVFDGGANKILAILSSDCILRLLDLESMSIIHTLYQPESSSSGIRKFIVSPTGKYFLCILQLGEVNIYNTSYVMELANIKPSKPVETPKLEPSTYKKLTPTQTMMTAEVEQRMNTCMDSARLRRILMQYGEYPDKFRPIIWRSLLNTPRNKVAYSALIEKGIHPVYKDIEKQFTIHSSITLKSLKRLLSCLAHWCPLFAVMKFLPGFVFPFVKVLQKDPLLLFESVATILINYCQLWFEYAPFPPISILAMTENVLGEHDQELLDHFCELGVTSQTYALTMLETAFSEILTCSEWLILWDHILSNEASFLLMAVVSYSIVQKNALKRLLSQEQVECFFHMQNPICKKAFLKKAYVLLNETPNDIHPQRFFDSFQSLEKGDCYQQFTGYPKATICLKLAKKSHKTKAHHTLKNLTKKSQERIIKERMNLCSESKSEPSDYADHQSVEEVFVSEKYLKRNVSLSKGDFDKKHSVHLKYKNNSGHPMKDEESGHKEEIKAKTRKKLHERKSYCLEREIEKLLKYDGDVSDS